MSKVQPELTAIAEQAGDELQIHYVSLSSLADKLLQGNSKKHDMGTLAESVNRYSFRDPIAFDTTLNDGNGGIVEGNGRLQYLLHAKDAGQPAPRGIKAKGDDWFVPVVFGVDAGDENEAIAYSVSHNLSALWGSDLTFLDQTRLFDESLLKDQLVGLAEMDMLPVGLDGDDLDLWLGVDGFESLEPLEEDDEAVNDLIDKAEDGQIESRVKLGDLVMLGKHRLICGDSTDKTTIERLLDGKKAQCCIQDPPYNVDYDPEQRVSQFSEERLTSGRLGKIKNDKMGDSEFRAFLDKVYDRTDESLEPGCPIYIFHADTMGHHFREAFVAQNWKLQSSLVWMKTVLTFGRADYHWKHEPILYGWKEGAPHRWYGDRKQTTIIEFSAPHYDKGNCDTDGYVHSCQKPTPLIEYLIANSSQPKDIVLDLFAGSGSTLIAAEKTDRVCYTSELDPRFATVVIERWERFTGKVAQIISS